MTDQQKVVDSAHVALLFFVHGRFNKDGPNGRILILCRPFGFSSAYLNACPNSQCVRTDQPSTQLGETKMETIRVQAGELRKGDEFVIGRHVSIIDGVMTLNGEIVCVSYHTYAFGPDNTTQLHTHMTNMRSNLHVSLTRRGA